jgi:hypothetical protein
MVGPARIDLAATVQVQSHSFGLEIVAGDPLVENAIDARFQIRSLSRPTLRRVGFREPAPETLSDAFRGLVDRSHWQR